MSDFLDSAHRFLAGRRIAIAGLSHDRDNPGNYIHRKLRAHGYEVFPVHPAAAEIDGDRCWRSVRDIPGGVDLVVITTHPDVTPRVVEDCIAAHVPRVWIHRGPGLGSASAEATRLCEEHGIELLDGGCPLMVIQPDIVHRCMRWLLDVRGLLPAGTAQGGKASAPLA